MNNQSNKQFHKHRLIEHTNGLSLAEVNGTVDVPKGKSFFKTLLAYSGPGALVAVIWTQVTGPLRSLVDKISNIY